MANPFDKERGGDFQLLKPGEYLMIFDNVQETEGKNRNGEIVPKLSFQFVPYEQGYGNVRIRNTVTISRSDNSHCYRLVKTLAGDLLTDAILGDKEQFWNLILALRGNVYVAQVVVSDDGRFNNMSEVFRDRAFPVRWIGDNKPIVPQKEEKAPHPAGPSSYPAQRPAVQQAGAVPATPPPAVQQSFSHPPRAAAPAPQFEPPPHPAGQGSVPAAPLDRSGRPVSFDG